MKCEKCGTEVPERAVICPECGEILPRKSMKEAKDQVVTTVPSEFDMPFLQQTVSEEGDLDKVDDPRILLEQARQKRYKRKRLIIILAIVLVLGICGTIYGTTFAGYKTAVFRYIKARDYCSGSSYMKLGTDTFLDYLEDNYDYDRREVKSSLTDYFKYWNEEYGTKGRMHYKINSTKKITDSESLNELEENLTEYSMDVNITEAVEVSMTIKDGDSSENQTATFVKISSNWYCMEAMEEMDFVIQYDGYDQW